MDEAKTFDRGFKAGIDTLINNTPGYIEFLGQVLGRLQSGFWEKEYIDMFFQNHFSGYDIYDAANFIRFHAWVRSGALLRVRIWVGDIPLADKQVEKNQSILNGLPKPFDACIERSYRGDGWLGWCKPIYLDRYSKKEDKYITRRIKANRCAPLEIGTTSSMRTMEHLLFDECLARWPYGYSEIQLFMMSREFIGKLRKNVSDRYGISVKDK